MIPVKTDMELCVIKSFKAAISTMKPKALIAICAQNLGRAISEKYRLTIISRLQRPSLMLRHWANPIFLNRFIRLQQQNNFTNQIRLPSVELHLTTILKSRPLSSGVYRSNLRNKSTHASSATFQFANYTDILHPDFHSQSRPMLQMWLKQARSISALIKKRLSEWQPSMDQLIGHGLSALKALFADFPMHTAVPPEVGPASLYLGRPASDRTRIKPDPLIFQPMSGLAPKHSGFLNRVLQSAFATAFMVPHGKIFSKMHLMQWDGHFCVNTGLPATTINGVRYNPDEEIEEKFLNRHFSILSHRTLEPLRHWPNRLIDTDELGVQRIPDLSDKKIPEAPPALTDKRIRHFTDNSSRENTMFSSLKPPKMKLAVSEKKAVPDFRGELQNIERRLKKIKPTESSPPQSNIDIHQISEKVYDEIERKLRIERERRGL